MCYGLTSQGTRRLPELFPHGQNPSQCQNTSFRAFWNFDLSTVMLPELLIRVFHVAL